MDLVQYYAKFGPKTGRARQREAGPGDGNGKPIASTVTAVQHSEPDHDPDAQPAIQLDLVLCHTDDRELEAEVDDNKEIPREELVALIKALRTPSQAKIKPLVVEFNRTRYAECTHCVAQNSECRVTPSSVRCDICVKLHITCSRTQVFGQWMVSSQFKLSWEKAGEVLEQGKSLYQEDQAHPNPVQATSAGLGTEQTKGQNNSTRYGRGMEPRTSLALLATAAQEARTSLTTPVLDLSGDQDAEAEVDDNKEVPRDELVTLVKHLQTRPTQVGIKPFVIEFNNTRQVECAHCVKKNSECRVTPSVVRCDACVSRRVVCSRAQVFGQWMVSRRFKLSWEKAEEVFERGKVLYRQDQGHVGPILAKVEDAGAEQSMNANTSARRGFTEPATSPASAPIATREARTSPRTPVPRVRKPPAGITTVIEPPVLSRPRVGHASSSHSRTRPSTTTQKRKRVLLKLPPRPDRKRRRIEAPATEAPTTPTPLPGASAPSFKPDPASRDVGLHGREILPPGRLVFTPPAVVEGGVSASVDPGADLARRVAATEARLDAIERELRTTWERAAEELSSAIAEIQGDKVQDATARLITLQTSFFGDPADTQQ